jgi:hypothetical protein
MAAKQVAQKVFMFHSREVPASLQAGYRIPELIDMNGFYDGPAHGIIESI